MSRSGRACLALLLLSLGAVTATAVRPVWTIDPDASLYVGLGKALAAGEGYSLDGVPHTKYPPGLPLIFAGLIRITGSPAYSVLHFSLVAALLGAVALSYLLVRRLGYGEGAALAVAAATGLSQTLFDLSVVYLRTEVLFLLVTLAALLALQRSLAPSQGNGRPAATAAITVAAALLCTAAMSIRLAGVALLAVPFAALLSPGLWAARGPTGGVRWRAALVLVLCGAALLAWQARAREVADRFPGAPDYGTEFLALEPRDLTKTVREDMPRLDGPGLVRRVSGNLEVLARATAVLLTNVDRAGSRPPVGVLLLGVTGAGLFALWRSGMERPRRRQAVVYVLAMLALCLVWPFNQQERFYVPLLPLLLLAAGEGVRLLLEGARRLTLQAPGRALVLAAGAALLLVLAWQRSDHPALLGRWSLSYAALLATMAGVWLVAFLLLRRGPLPAPRPALLLAAPVLLALPWAHHRFVEWPATRRAFDEHRAAHPQPEPLASIDVDRRLESVAVFLRDGTPPGTVLMTDVPSMLQIMSGRRCIPFVYRVQPPSVLTGDADLVFYTREIAEASAVMDAVAPRLEPAFALPPVDDGGRLVTPTVYRTR